jgi:hypothetical protein
MKDFTMRIVRGESGYPQLMVDLPSLAEFFFNESAVIAPEDVFNLLEAIALCSTEGTNLIALRDWKDWCSRCLGDEEECPE